MNRRVVVTGVGLVCALGIGTEEVWKNLLAGKSGVARITGFDPAGFDCQIAGEVKNFDPFQWIEKKELKKMGRFMQLALAAADFAVRMSGWQPSPAEADTTGVYVSSGIGGFDIIEREHGKFLQGGPGKISPFFIPSAIVNLRTHFHPLRCARAKLGHGDGLLGFRARHRRLLQDHPARRCRRDDFGRRRGVHHTHGRRRLFRHESIVHAQ